MTKIIDSYRKVNKQTKIHLIFLILFCLIQVIIITKFQYIFGSSIDWMKQHVVFPDYFRNLFYQTGNLFPDFAAHLGSGQNIFYFAYYGLYNPIILFSYLLPFIPMNIYIMITSIISVIASVILFYYFLRKNGFSNNNCFFVSLLFLFSSSFLFHSHRHIMFVNYMPFLVLSLIGVWYYFEKHRSGLLIISTFLMILTSYYYSISGIIVICLYGLFYYLKLNNNILFKSLVKNAFSFLIRIFSSVLLAFVLLLPLIYVILNGRISEINTFDFSLLIPNVDIEYLMYGTYGIGLTSILWISLIYNILYLPKQYRIISIITGVIIIIPIFNYLLNGGLYLDGKVFIPFLPLFLIFIISMIKDIRIHKIRWKWLFIAVLVSILFLININDNKIYFFSEIIITMILLYKYQKNKKFIYLAPVVIFSFFISITNHNQDDLVTIENYKKQSSYYNYDILNYINHNTDSIYRYQDDLSDANGMNFSYGDLDYRTAIYSSTSNLNYRNSFYNIFNNNNIYRNCFMLDQTNNLFFQNFMGIRYLLTNSKVPFGYNSIKEYNDGILYENPNVYPIGFSTTHLLNQMEYNNLNFIEKLLAFQKNIIVAGNSNYPILNKSYENIKLDYVVKEKKNIDVNYNDGHYLISSDKDGKVLLELEDSIINEVVVIRFKMNDIPSCKNGDNYIKINGIMNKITCGSWKYYNGNETFDYVLSSNDKIDEIEIIFDKGDYDISDIQMYKIDSSFFEKSDITPLLIDVVKTKGDVIVGNINQLEDGYFMFTIPYDDGFEVFVDDKRIKLEKVNESFIGFSLEKGDHVIRLEFEAPYSDLGKVISLLSFGAIIIIIVYEKKRFK